MAQGHVAGGQGQAEVRGEEHVHPGMHLEAALAGAREQAPERVEVRGLAAQELAALHHARGVEGVAAAAHLDEERVEPARAAPSTTWSTDSGLRRPVRTTHRPRISDWDAEGREGPARRRARRTIIQDGIVPSRRARHRHALDEDALLRRLAQAVPGRGVDPHRHHAVGIGSALSRNGATARESVKRLSSPPRVVTRTTGASWGEGAGEPIQSVTS